MLRLRLKEGDNSQKMRLTEGGVSRILAIQIDCFEDYLESLIIAPAGV